MDQERWIRVGREVCGCAGVKPGGGEVGPG